MISYYIILGIVIIALFLLFSLYNKQSRSLASLHQKNEDLQKRVDSVIADIQSITRSAVGADQKIASLTKIHKNLSLNVDKLESLLADERPYKSAIDLAKKGATAEHLMQELHLSEGEAQLIRMLHGTDANKDGEESNSFL